MPPIVVLYEDQAASGSGQLAQFGPHKLVVSSVCDALGGDWGLSKRGIEQQGLLDGRPQKGVPKLLKAVRALRETNSHVVAVVDGDQAARQLGLPSNASVADIVTAIQGPPAPGWERIHAVVLDKNLESIIQQLQSCWDQHGRGHRMVLEEFDRALKKRLNDRDIVLGKAAVEAARALRDCLRERMPTFAGLVDLVRELAEPALSPAPPA